MGIRYRLLGQEDYYYEFQEGGLHFFQGIRRQDPVGGCSKSLGELPEQLPRCTSIVHPNVQDRARGIDIAGDQPG